VRSKAKIEGALIDPGAVDAALSLVLFGFLVQYVEYIPALVALFLFGGPRAGSSNTGVLY